VQAKLPTCARFVFLEFRRAPEFGLALFWVIDSWLEPTEEAGANCKTVVFCGALIGNVNDFEFTRGRLERGGFIPFVKGK
jgi:hypothetical protein